MNNVEEEIFKLGSDWAHAMVANDADLIGSFMADDWLMVSERGVSDKEHFLGFIRSGKLTHSAFEMVGNARVLDLGDSAVMIARIMNTAHFEGTKFDADEWTTDVFVRRGGKWLCVLSHITPSISEDPLGNT
ncbi:MAG TPA: nuclear transport factor 2 family protein [Pyrinomonadaceae bacterium]|nr:nuclear transport factor 2 family protein [Pyrinomonadaceae bacterium]